MRKFVHNIFVLPLGVLVMLGFFQIGNSDVLCIGEDGHMEIESECFPCCNESETACELIDQKDIHNEHDECHNCSDLTLDNQFWIKRFSKITSFEKLYSYIDQSLCHNKTSIVFDQKMSQSHNNPFLLVQTSNSSFLLTTILRC